MTHTLGSLTRFVFRLASLVALLWSTVVSAQTQSGLLNGALRDSSGGALPGVTVTLVEERAGTEQSTVTGARAVPAPNGWNGRKERRR